MMREILFRGKRIDNGELVKGFLVKHPSAVHIGDYSPWYISIPPKDPDDNGGLYNIIPETVGQFTGLTDMNGKKIFEGDICRFREWSGGDMCWIGKVHFEHQQFLISGGPNKECETPFELQMSRFIPDNIEIIGNIHDNPELLAEN